MGKGKITRIILIIAIIAIIVALNCVKKDKPLGEWTMFTTAFGSTVEITIHPSKFTDANSIFNNITTLIRTYNETFNIKDPSSELSLLNNFGGGEEKSLSTLLYTVISDAKYYHKISGGAFNPAVGGLIKTMESGVSPVGDIPLNFEDIALGYNNTVIIPEGMTIDLGGIVKGVFADEVVRNYGYNCRGLLISVGGDIATYGSPPGKNYWDLEVYDPLNDDCLYFQLPPNFSVATSGSDYRRIETGEGSSSSSHIIDPGSGEGIEGRIFATVFAVGCGQADALATAMCVLGGEEGVLLAEMVEGVECYIVEEVDGEVAVYMSSGLGAFCPEEYFYHNELQIDK